MWRDLFNKIAESVGAGVPYFSHRKDATGMKLSYAATKCTMVVRQLASGGAANTFDEYLKMGDSTGRESLKEFCKAVIDIYGLVYLRKPTSHDVTRLLAMYEARHGFLGMLKNIDCMHWGWKNYPKAWTAAYTRDDQGEPTMILEAIASYDLWIWHAFFGVAGSNNDINVLNQSDLFTEFLHDRAPPCTFQVNGRQYRLGYYLTDEIYLEWPALVNAPPIATDLKTERFKKMQESARKDVERAFEVLQARWGIIKNPARMWNTENLREIMFACIILHNMIIEDEEDSAMNWRDDDVEALCSSSQPRQTVPICFEKYLERTVNLKDKREHARLTNDLIEDIWARFGPIRSNV